MKRKSILLALAMSALLMLALTGCGKSVFGVAENTEKRISITAENADKDAFFMVGSLEVADGERIVITSSLAKGAVRVEIVAAPEDQSMDSFPKMDGDAIITADVSRTDGASGTVPAGSYLLRAVCLEKATGTIQIEVRPVG